MTPSTSRMHRPGVSATLEIRGKNQPLLRDFQLPDLRADSNSPIVTKILIANVSTTVRIGDGAPATQSDSTAGLRDRETASSGMASPPDVAAEQTCVSRPISNLYHVKDDRYILLRCQEESSQMNFPHFLEAKRTQLDMDLKNSKSVVEENAIDPRRATYTLELFFSGSAIVETHVNLFPTIWIRCTRASKGTITKALKEEHLKWIQNSIDKDVFIFPFLKMLDEREGVRIDGLDLSGGFSFGDSYQMHLHVQEVTADSSACGLVCCTTITHHGGVVDQSLSRIGGVLVQQDNGAGNPSSPSLVAVSTAHGMLDYLLSRKLMLDYPKAIMDSVDSEDDRMSSAVSAAEHGDSKNPEIPVIGSIDLQGITQWKKISSAQVFDFIENSTHPKSDEKWVFSGPRLAHDFALFNIDTNVANSYVNNSERTLVVGYLEDKYLPKIPQKVHILISQHNPPQGHVIPEKSGLFIGGMRFETRDVILEHPLGRCSCCHITHYSLGTTNKLLQQLELPAHGLSQEACSSGWSLQGTKSYQSLTLLLWKKCLPILGVSLTCPY